MEPRLYLQKLHSLPSAKARYKLQQGSQPLLLSTLIYAHANLADGGDEQRLH
jgi:hypothetical protein